MSFADCSAASWKSSAKGAWEQRSTENLLSNGPVRGTLMCGSRSFRIKGARETSLTWGEDTALPGDLD